MTAHSLHSSTDQLQKVLYELLQLLPSTSRTSKSDNLKDVLHSLTQLFDNKIKAISLSNFNNVDEFEEEWVVLVWSLFVVLARLPDDTDDIQNLNHLLVTLVNKAQPIRVPKLLGGSEQYWQPFIQQFNQTLHVMHDLYSQLENPTPNIQPNIVAFVDHQLRPCLEAFREMFKKHLSSLHTSLRKSQIDHMSRMCKPSEGDVQHVPKSYINFLYILGLLAARLQGFQYECRSSTAFLFAQSETVTSMLNSVLGVYHQLLNDALVCTEPYSSPILVTNNLFTFNSFSLCPALLFQHFDVQIVSEDTAVAIQTEMVKVRCGIQCATSSTQFPSAALLAMKPTTGVKRNNATANSTGGGNTAHKKSDVNSKESVRLAPTYNERYRSWQASYPHLLCTTRQKDAVLLDNRSGQIGKRPLFYFYIRATAFSPLSDQFTVRTLSLPFTIATRRNQDCQVQRMMSSYTATCFWLYGTCAVKELILEWNDAPLPWSRFKELCCQYFQVNAEVKRPILETDFDILSDKMICDECNEYSDGTGEKSVTFKNMLCAHLRYDTQQTSMRISVWRGILEVLQIFQEQKSNVKTIWDDYILHGFLDTNTTVSLVFPHASTLCVRLTYILGGSVCVTIRKQSPTVVHLEPIELKKLQTKSILEYIADIAESAKIDYILTARHELLPVNQFIASYKIGAEMPRIRAVTSNVSHMGALDQMHCMKFTPLRVAVVTCRNDEHEREHEQTPQYGTPNTEIAAPGVHDDFGAQLEELMKSYGKSPAEVSEHLSQRSPMALMGVFCQPAVHFQYPQDGYDLF